MQVQLSDQVLCQYNLSGDLAIADGDELRFAEFEIFSDPGYSFIRWVNIPPRLIKALLFPILEPFGRKWCEIGPANRPIHNPFDPARIQAMGRLSLVLEEAGKRVPTVRPRSRVALLNSP